MNLDLVYSILMAVKVILVFTFVFILIPAQLIRFGEQETILDKVFISLVQSSLATILLVHLLAFVRLYETFSLMFAFLALYIVQSWIKGGSPVAVADALGMKLIVNLLDMSEGKSGLGGGLFRQVKKWFDRGRTDIGRWVRDFLCRPFTGIFFGAVLLVAAALRFKHSIFNAYFASSDAYVHLTWIKYLGANEIYRDGVYSYGYHAILSAIQKLTLMDPYFIIRFIGPITGMLLILSLYYFVSKNFKDPYAALIAVTIYGLSTSGWFFSIAWRHISALPQEFAAVFLLPGLHFFYIYLEKGTKRHLWLAAQCLALTLLIHLYITVFLALGYALMFILYPGRMCNINFLTKTTMTLVVSALVGILPIMVGLLMGKQFYGSSINYLERNINLSAPKDLSVSGFSEYNPLFLILLISIILLLLKSVYMALRRNENKFNKIYLFSALFSLIWYLQYRASDYGLPVIMDKLRIEVSMVFFMIITYAGVLSVIDLFIRREAVLNVVKGTVTVAVLVSVLIFIPLRAPVGDRFEYNEAAKAYIKIKNSFPALSWTIVAPGEQYQQAWGYGWHYQILEFAKMIPEPGDGKKVESVTIPTDYIFIFAEKIPLGSKSPVEMTDLEKEIPNPEGDLTKFYYLNPENRRILEAKVYFWAEDYLKKKKNMEVYFDGEHLKIYLIRQDGKRPVKLFS